MTAAGGTVVPPTASAHGDPDLILHDAVVITLDPPWTVAEAVAVEGERIVSVGSDDEVLPTAGPSTTVVDLDGLAVLPGFIDSHSPWIGDRELHGVTSAQEAIRLALEGGWTTINELFVNQDRLDELIALAGRGARSGPGSSTCSRCATTRSSGYAGSACCPRSSSRSSTRRGRRTTGPSRETGVSSSGAGATWSRTGGSTRSAARTRRTARDRTSSRPR